MRNLLCPALLASITACSAAAGQRPDPPVLKIATPSRGLVQSQAGTITVTGTAVPGERGEPIEQVTVNGKLANLHADGTFDAQIEVPPGASSIETAALDAGGRTASDVRAVQAGARSPLGTPIPRAVTVAMSPAALDKISAAAGPIVRGLDLGAMLAPSQPMIHAGDSNGEDCLFGAVYIDDLAFSNVALSLSPVTGGMAFRIEIDGLSIQAHARYRVACLPTAETTVAVGADQVVIAGTLEVAPSGADGFATHLVDPDVQLTGLDLDLSGLPGEVIDLLHIDDAIKPVIAKAAELAMNPLVNQALGALGRPQQLDVLGTQLALQVDPSAIAFEPSGATVALDLTLGLAGGDPGAGFLFTANGTPAIDPTTGFTLGVADDLVNEMLAGAQTAGLLDLAVPVPGGVFDTAELHMTLPPLLVADRKDGKLRIVLGDVGATFTAGGKPLAHASLNATVDLAVVPAGGTLVQLELSPPQIHIDVTDDLPNLTGVDDDALGTASAAVLASQLDTISTLLALIPLPSIEGLVVKQLSVGADQGYLMIRGQL